ncbi:hypothetical protein GKQ77_21795 [Streptomyces sp. BG9H]|uniref:Uncharacterized protein n=1 Tax=Streptomyces anatolicus TaxID=2675858 RepID=A0ABS6YRX3_9ACTN|nr:hypothetical protein [Streptomyces anatolicus]MBW5424165.1 hypothetical protein [Streptomyces anatolicus]
MRLGKALATGIAEEQPREEESARMAETSVPDPGPRTAEAVPEPRPVEAAVTR